MSIRGKEEVYDELPKLSIQELSLYRLMSDVSYVSVSVNSDLEFNLEIESGFDRDVINFSEERISKCAADEFASFCRRYLHSYEMASKMRKNLISHNISQGEKKWLAE